MTMRTPSLPSPDPLSDVLTTIGVRNVVAGGVTAGDAWGLAFTPRDRLKLVAVLRGQCWLAVDGATPPRQLRHGDVAMLRDRRFVALSSAPGRPLVDVG